MADHDVVEADGGTQPITVEADGGTQPITVEADTAEKALAIVHERFGDDAKVLAARKVLRGGVAGFFQREAVQLEVRPPGAEEPNPVAEALGLGADDEHRSFGEVLRARLEAAETEAAENEAMATDGAMTRTSATDAAAPVGAETEGAATDGAETDRPATAVPVESGDDGPTAARDHDVATDDDGPAARGAAAASGDDDPTASGGDASAPAGDGPTTGGGDASAPAGDATSGEGGATAGAASAEAAAAPSPVDRALEALFARRQGTPFGDPLTLAAGASHESEAGDAPRGDAITEHHQRNEDDTMDHSASNGNGVATGGEPTVGPAALTAPAPTSEGVASTGAAAAPSQGSTPDAAVAAAQSATADAAAPPSRATTAEAAAPTPVATPAQAAAPTPAATPAPGGPAWSSEVLRRLGLPAEVVEATRSLDPADDVAWVSTLARAVTPLCGPLPAGRTVLAGPRVHGFARALDVPVVESQVATDEQHVAVKLTSPEDVSWLSWLARDRALHLVLGSDAWRRLLLEDVAVVSWATAWSLPEAIRVAVEFGVTLGYRLEDGRAVRATPLDLALALRALVPVR